MALRGRPVLSGGQEWDEQEMRPDKVSLTAVWGPIKFDEIEGAEELIVGDRGALCGRESMRNIDEAHCESLGFLTLFAYNCPVITVTTECPEESAEDGAKERINTAILVYNCQLKIKLRGRLLYNDRQPAKGQHFLIVFWLFRSWTISLSIISDLRQLIVSRTSETFFWFNLDDCRMVAKLI